MCVLQQHPALCYIFSASWLTLHICHPNLPRSLVDNPNLESHREEKSGKPSSSLAKLTRWKVTMPHFHSTKCFCILLPYSSRPLCLCMDCSPQPWHLESSYSTFKTLQRYHLLRKEFPDTFPPGPVLYFVHNACLYCTC